jgi:diguanylate cyclase (GGDEF)-like protein
MAAVILNSINTQVSETSYILSKNITGKEDILKNRALIDRMAANNDFVDAIVIHNGKDILLTTDPLYKKIIPTSLLYSNSKNIYNKLMNTVAREENIKYYKNNKAQYLKLLFVFDKKEIDNYFSKHTYNYIILFFVIPFIILILIWLSIRKYIISPLELLRQFAYYQNKIPKAFMIEELEVIRYSMVETFQRLEKEKKELYEIARKDSLSGLANRNALMEFMDRLIVNSRRNNKEFAMLFLDLDNFKSVNDSLGHNVGDELLKKISSIIDNVLRSNDFVARVGGDEFIIIIQDYNSLLELINIIDRIQNTVSNTWIIQTNPINISSSVGIAFYPKDGEDTISLMKNSDIAMYEAKKNGRSRYHFFTEDLNKRVQDTIALEKDMKKALVNNEYELYYQPKVDINSDKIVAVEALIRWVKPDKGVIPPSEFISLAEEDGFIVELGEWVYKTAIKQQKIFIENGINIDLSINVSSKQFSSDDFFKKFIDTIKQYNIDPRTIDIEITEYLFLQHTKRNIKALTKLHDYGIQVSLDDFGTRYSSLSYLKDFPIDNLKIDKSFIDDLSHDRDRVFVDTIVKMAQTLKLNVIAEGVETQEQLEYLKDIQCNQYQGYLKSKPLPANQFMKLYLKN